MPYERWGYGGAPFFLFYHNSRMTFMGKTGQKHKIIFLVGLFLGAKPIVPRNKVLRGAVMDKKALRIKSITESVTQRFVEFGDKRG